MERIPDSRYSELISAAYSCIPPNVAKLIDHVHFFCGTDPVYAGLVKETDIPLKLNEKQLTSRNWMYCLSEEALVWTLPKNLIHPTIVIPYFNIHQFGVSDIVHELGHILDDVTPYFAFHDEITSVSEYAETNDSEAFAEAFCSWLFWGYDKQPDAETLYYFEKLKKGEIY